MKRTPHTRKIEEMMRSGHLVAGSLLGDDPRPLEEIVEVDAAELARLDTDKETVAARMAALTERAMAGLGSFVRVGDALEVAADDNRGMVVCPYGDDTRHFKTVTTARRIDTGKEVRWSGLSIHLIGAHGFFEGRGAAFRLEPADLVEIIL